MHYHRLLVWLLASCLLFACATPAPRISDLNVDAVVSHLASRADFVGAGRVDDNRLLVVAVFGPGVGVDQIVRSVLPADIRFEVRHVPHSLRELNTLAGQISSQEMLGTTADPNVTVVDVDELNGVVVIGVDQLTDRVDEEFRAKYGRAVVVRQHGKGTLL